MSTFWTIWISVITLGSIIGCYILLRWCLTNFTEVEEGEDMHHFFDGIVEINNPLPRWWTILFYIVIVWGLVYLALFPGLGAYKGLLGWKSSNQGVLSLADSKKAVQQALEAGEIVEYDREVRAADERFGPIFEAFAKVPVEQLADDPEAIKVGQRLFLQNCAQCHGSDARGQTGFPNLTDDDWLWGGSGDKIKETLLQGRMAAMPGWLPAMGEQGIKEVVNYVLTFSGRDHDKALAQAGKTRFDTMCAACHGVDGKGNQLLGAANLTDQTWLYGGSVRALTETLNYGRNGVMPKFDQTLGEEKVHVVAAYVYSLSKNN